MNRDELNEDIRIDPTQLDIEAARQAELFLKWAELAVAAKNTLDRLEFAMEVLEAKLSLRCREEPESFGLKSITEPGIKAAVRRHPKYIEATDNFHTARYEHGMLMKAADAMEQKKRMIEVLIALHGQEYFAGPSVPRDLVSAWRDYRDKGASEVADKQRNMIRKRVSRKDDV